MKSKRVAVNGGGSRGFILPGKPGIQRVNWRGLASASKHMRCDGIMGPRATITGRNQPGQVFKRGWPVFGGWHIEQPALCASQVSASDSRKGLGQRDKAPVWQKWPPVHEAEQNGHVGVIKGVQGWLYSPPPPPHTHPLTQLAASLHGCLPASLASQQSKIARAIGTDCGVVRGAGV